MISVNAPLYYDKEFDYCLSVVLGEFLGLTYQLHKTEIDYLEFSDGVSDFKLSINADFYANCQNNWLKEGSMPLMPLRKWTPIEDGLDVDLIKPTVPVLYGLPGLVKNAQHWHLNLDIFGSVFFMLSRYEELIKCERDQHNRFPATASIAYKSEFLDRPIVDEYVEILWTCLSSLWPSLSRKDRKSKNFITCDVDWPLDPCLQSLKKTIVKSGVSLIRERSFTKSFLVIWNYSLNKLGIKVRDEYRDSISWIMDVNEKSGNKVAFYFISYCTSKFDSHFNFDSPEMRALFREIHSRGHEIGVHPGYETFDNSLNLKKTVEELKRVLHEEGIEQEKLGGRQHYLRWDSKQTPQKWEQLGLDYDSTLSYADMSGFRCGTSHEYSMYDLIARKPMKLKERPLITMECSIISTIYEGLGYSAESLGRFKYFKKNCHKYGGVYTLLWHNSHFENLKDQEFYKELIQ